MIVPLFKGEFTPVIPSIARNPYRLWILHFVQNDIIAQSGMIVQPKLIKNNYYICFTFLNLYIQNRYGRKMQTSVKKWGNSLAIRVPQAIASQINITEGSKIKLILKNNIIEIYS